MKIKKAIQLYNDFSFKVALAWRQNWLKKTFSGKETVFGHLMKNFPL